MNSEIKPFEEYKLFTEMTDRLSQRRQNVHTTFEAVLTALFALLYFLAKDMKLHGARLSIPVVIICALGLAVCFVWRELINRYRELLDFRFKKLMKMEEQFTNSVRMFTSEMDFFRKKSCGKSAFKFSILERNLPLVFGIVFFLLLVGSVYLWLTGAGGQTTP